MSDLRPLPLAGERTLVLAFDPELAAANLSLAGEVMVVSDRPCQLLGLSSQPEQVSWRELFSLRGSRRVRDFAPTTAVLNTLRGAWPGPVWAAARYGVRRFLLVDAPGGFHEVELQLAGAIAGVRVLRRVLGRAPGSGRLEALLGQRFDPPWPSPEGARESARLIAARAKARGPRALPAGGLEVVHLIGTLGPGGSERQLTYLVEGSVRAGHRVEVWVPGSLEGERGHYAPKLRALGVVVRELECQSRTWNPRAEAGGLGLSGEELRALERHVAIGRILPLAAALRARRPDLLHCWLDETNLTGALAGLLVGLPRILLSTRNLSPLRAPRLLEAWFRETYREVAGCPSVRLIANSRAGAEDYARWSETEPEGWEVVRNGIDCERVTPLSAAERQGARRELGVAPEQFLVVSVFRLASEKRPEDFLAVVARLRERVPALRVIHVGAGELASQIEARAEELGLGGVLSFMGRSAAPWRILGAADASLLTSEIEGLPNVSLESQALEVPIVLTRAGGAPESVRDGVTGYVREVGDVEGLCERLEILAGDGELRRRLGVAGRAWVEEEFSMGRMIERTLALYR